MKLTMNYIFNEYKYIKFGNFLFRQDYNHSRIGERRKLISEFSSSTECLLSLIENTTPSDFQAQPEGFFVR